MRRHIDKRHFVSVAIEEIFISEKTIEKLQRRDQAQIEAMRLRYEAGHRMVPVVLCRRFGGGYNIEDGRHRIIAAGLAELSFINAVIA